MPCSVCDRPRTRFHHLECLVNQTDDLLDRFEKFLGGVGKAITADIRREFSTDQWIELIDYLPIRIHGLDILGIQVLKSSLLILYRAVLDDEDPKIIVKNILIVLKMYRRYILADKSDPRTRKAVFPRPPSYFERCRSRVVDILGNDVDLTEYFINHIDLTRSWITDAVYLLASPKYVVDGQDDDTIGLHFEYIEMVVTMVCDTDHRQKMYTNLVS